MQYRQSREQSAEILRMALGHMGRQRAAFYPTSYALWYEHSAGLNPALSAVLEEGIATGRSLTDADVSRLYAQYIVRRDGDAIERIHERLLVLLKETSEIVSDTGSHTVQFTETLVDQSLRLKQPASLDLIRSIVSELLTEAQHMCAANATLARQLDTSSQEVLNLTHRLERMQVEALNDPLTGLLNRRGFERAIAELGIPPGQLNGAALLVVDIDHFKRVNDSHGHLVGDQVLCAAAQVLRARTKGSDITARLGGDEFAVLLPRTSLTGAVALAEQIRTTLLDSRLRRIDREEYIENLTLSVGVAEARPADQLADLLRRADTALYQAKRSGRNQVSRGATEGPAG
jgi:diguanylate cyclase